MLLGAEQVRIAQVAGADLGEDFTPRRHRLRLERFDRRAGEDLARHHALHQPLHRHRRDQREQAARIDRRVDAPRIGAGLEPVERVPHPELDLRHRQPLGSAQLDGGLARGPHGARGVEQLDAARGTRSQLAEELRVDRGEPGGDLVRLGARRRLGRVSLGEQRMAARVHHVSSDPVDLPHGGCPGGNSPGGPLRPRPLEPGPVGEAQLLQFDPGSADARAAGGEADGPWTFSLEDCLWSGAVRGAGPHGERTAGRDDHLAPALGDADRDEGLTLLEGEAARVEELEGIVRGGGAGEEIGGRRNRLWG